MLVPDWLHHQASARPEHPAVISAGGGVSFRALEERVDLLTRRLRAAGVGRGTRVAAFLENGLPLVELIHAAPRAGAALILLYSRLTPPEAGRLAEHARARLIFAQDETRLAAHAAAVASGAELVFCGPDEPPLAKVKPLAAPAEPPVLELDVAHTIVFTSGVSGEPKAVVLTAGNHLWSAFGSACLLGVQHDDRWLLCLPASHVGGLAVILRSAIYGTTVVLHRHFDAEAVARALAEDRVTLVSLVPTTLARLMAALGKNSAPATLRCALIGGGPVAPDLLVAARARGLPVAPTYGLTETASQVATVVPGDPAVGTGSVGRPLLPTRVRIVRVDGFAAGPDEQGEIQVQGPTVTPGYLAAEQSLPPAGSELSLRPATQDGWLPTGDLGRLDPSGALAVLGRRDDIIISGGEKVNPAEVEAVLSTLPGVAEAAVAGVPDAGWGQAVAAWVVPRTGHAPSLDELRQACRVSLAPHKLPRRLFLVKELPRTALGKVRRGALRQTATSANRTLD